MTVRECSDCEHCGEVILRLPGGLWQHRVEPDEDHLPEPEPTPMTEAQAERQLGERQLSGGMGLVDAGDGLHYDPTAADFVKVVKLEGGYL